MDNYKFSFIICLAFIGFATLQVVQQDCKGKGFICTDSTHFLICAAINDTHTYTLDNETQTCPADTSCNNNDEFECFSGPVTTVRPVTKPRTTAKPVTKPITTAKPVTKPRTTAKPVTKPRTTIKPATKPRTTVKPVTKPRTTVKPVTKPRTTVKPATKPRTTVKPVTKPKTTIKPKTTPKPTCPRVGNFEDPDNCQVYCYCDGLVKKTRPCAFNTVFDAVRKVCSPDLSKCGTNDYRCLLHGNFRDRRTCQSYFYCPKNHKGRGERKHCNQGEAFYELHGKCLSSPRGCNSLDKRH